MSAPDSYYVRQLLQKIHGWAMAQSGGPTGPLFDMADAGTGRPVLTRPFAHRTAFHQALALYLRVEPGHLSQLMADAITPWRMEELDGDQWSTHVLEHLQIEDLVDDERMAALCATCDQPLVRALGVWAHNVRADCSHTMPKAIVRTLPTERPDTIRNGPR